MDDYYLVTSPELDDFKNQATSKEIEISGNVAISGVTMIGLPGKVVCDSEGQYRVNVPFGWAGKVEPFKEGYKFDPPGMIYSLPHILQRRKAYNVYRNNKRNGHNNFPDRQGCG